MNPKPISLNGYACAKCGRPYYLQGAEDAWALSAATTCCMTKTCPSCGKDISVTASLCLDCDDLRHILDAKEIPLDDPDVEMVYHKDLSASGCSGDRGYVLKEMLLETTDDMEPGTAPAYVWATTFMPVSLNAQDIEEQALSDHGDWGYINDPESLDAFVKDFNAKQTSGSFEPDYSRPIVLDRERFDELKRKAFNLKSKGVFK